MGHDITRSTRSTLVHARSPFHSPTMSSATSNSSGGTAAATSSIDELIFSNPAMCSAEQQSTIVIVIMCSLSIYDIQICVAMWTLITWWLNLSLLFSSIICIQGASLLFYVHDIGRSFQNIYIWPAPAYLGKNLKSSYDDIPPSGLRGLLLPVEPTK